MKPNSPPGQAKLHTVVNPSTGETREVTQAQWKNRANDPSLAGFERQDDDDSTDDSTTS